MKQVLETMYLDSKLIGQPTAALQLVVKEIVRCMELVGANLKELISVLEKNDGEKASDVIGNAEDTRSLYDRITEYLAELFASGGLTEEQATQTAGVMYILSDVDRMGVLCREIGLSLKDKEEKNYKYSERAIADLKTSLELIQKMYFQATDLRITGNSESAKKILKQKEQIMDLGIKMRKSHVQRVGKGKCAAQLTESFNKIIHSADRMGNCCINLVDAVQGQVGLRYFLEYSDYDAKEGRES
ncbi:MAG: PhoU domain-containing protein [Fusicatenibacter sp.]